MFREIAPRQEVAPTTNLTSISMSKQKRLPTPIPPAAEQTRIVAEVEYRFSVTKEVKAWIAASLRRAESLNTLFCTKRLLVNSCNHLPQASPTHTFPE